MGPQTVVKPKTCGERANSMGISVSSVSGQVFPFFGYKTRMEVDGNVRRIKEDSEILRGYPEREIE